MDPDIAFIDVTLPPYFWSAILVGSISYLVKGHIGHRTSIIYGCYSCHFCYPYSYCQLLLETLYNINKVKVTVIVSIRYVITAEIITVANSH